MTITVSVYQKDGLCRGPAIGNATFHAVTEAGSIIYYDIPLSATGGPPLSGSTNVYTVVGPLGLTEWYLRVASPIHNPWDFFVRDGETHEVWLTHQ
jgi:hypothetical protein